MADVNDEVSFVRGDMHQRVRSLVVHVVLHISHGGLCVYVS